MDYTYFSFFNEYLKNHKLRIGIIINHEKMQFELWLMGQNASIQKEYWEIFKDTNWNKDIKILLEQYPDDDVDRKINIANSVLHRVI